MGRICPKVNCVGQVQGPAREASVDKAVSERRMAGERCRGPAGAESWRALWASIKGFGFTLVSGGPWQGFEERDTA